jgi:putative sigma-54 modulation protein
MKVTYTGRQAKFPPAQIEKIEGQFSKLAKLLDGKGQREAHVVFSQERHLQHAEVTVNYFNHALVGIGSDTEQFPALHDALEKLEKQALKVRAKWRDTKRTPAAKNAAVNGASETAEEEPAEEEKPGQIHRVRLKNKLRPMTLDEAVIAMDGRAYIAYRDAQTELVQLLVRRGDGDLDLIEV